MSGSEAGKATRAFIALDLPDVVRAGVEEWGESELTDPALRKVAGSALHVTLNFLGALGPEDLRVAAGIVYETAPAPTPIRLDAAPVGLPGRGREKRVFALGCESPAAIALQGNIQHRLVAARILEPEREFWPHLTVARVRPAAEGGRRRGKVIRPPGPLPAALREPFDAVRITLYRSKIKSAGPEYTPLAQVELPRGIHAGQR